MDWIGETIKSFATEEDELFLSCLGGMLLAKALRAAHETGCEWKHRSKLEDAAAVENDKLRLALTSARAACGEAAEILDQMMGITPAGEEFVAKLKAIAAGKEAT